MSSAAPSRTTRERPAEIAAGYLAAISMTASVIALVYRPVRLAPFAILVALIAARCAADRTPEARGAAVASGTLAWLVGMAIAVL